MQFFLPIETKIQYSRTIVSSPATVTDSMTLSPNERTIHPLIIELRTAIGAIDKKLYLTNPNLIDYFRGLMQELDACIEENHIQINHLTQLLLAYHLSDEHRKSIISYFEIEESHHHIMCLLGSSDEDIQSFISDNQEILSAIELDLLQKPYVFRKWLVNLLKDKAQHHRYFQLFAVQLDDDPVFKQEYMEDEVQELQNLNAETIALERQFRNFKLKYDKIFKPRVEMASCLSAKREIDVILSLTPLSESNWGLFVSIDEDSQKQIQRSSPSAVAMQFSEKMNFKSV